MVAGHGEGSAGVRAVERAVALLFRVAERPEGASLRQLADEVGCSKSTVHRLLATLERLEVVERDPALRQYRLGRRLRALRQEAPAVDLRALAEPHLVALRDAVGETASLHVLDGAAHVVVAQAECRHAMRLILPLGQRIPLQKGATAKAILAFLPAAQQAVLGIPPLPHAVLSAEEREDIRGLGYAYSYAERVPGSSAIAVPLRDARGWVVGALALSGPSVRFTPARAVRSAPALLEAARQIETALRHGVAPQAS
ncbi:MAG TPA: IclR family transcriptional regulator [Chloroflexota bacterium]|jgi:DNA-binding IclR family transcriptional regulator|nr:IclR family transcriptional regulator [Chloroflexota bacterium]